MKQWNRTESTEIDVGFWKYLVDDRVSFSDLWRKCELFNTCFWSCFQNYLEKNLY